MRGDLVRILHDISSGTVEYLFDESIRDVRADDGGVTVDFDRGMSRRFDLVVGADGLHSSVRRLTMGPETEFVRHMNHYFAFGDVDAERGPDRWVSVYNTPGRMAGVYRSGNHAQAKGYFIFRSPRLDIDLRDRKAVRELLFQRFGSERSRQVRPLLDDVLADSELYVDSLAQVRLPHWSAGRIALVGDAAYCASPASGAGAELALIGAYRLAGELAAADGDHDVAFRRYERGLRELVARKQRIGPNLRLLAPRTRAGIVVRNTLTRVPLLESLAGMERIMAPKGGEPLPDYRAVAGSRG